MANLKLFHANKIYDGGVHALKDFCLDVDDKEFVVFVGPSGCGKSTALRMIAGLEKITSGDIFIGDKLVNGLPPKDRNIAMVFQSYALFPNMSVYDNISYGLRMQGVDKAIIDQKVNSAAELLSLTDYLDRKPSQLSGGQKQRVALGRAIVREPSLFLLDEPLSNLDAKLRAKMRSEILALHDRLGITFVYVTHDQTEAMTMGDKIVVMSGGKIMQVGSPQHLYHYPANKFVASFIGTPQMNFWSGELNIGDQVSVRTDIGDFTLTHDLELRLDVNKAHNGQRVILGIRPEDVYTERKNEYDIPLYDKISVIEELCTHTILHLDSNGVDIVAQGISETNHVGEEIMLYANPQGLHIFDAESEETILPEYAVSSIVNGEKSGNTLNVLGCSLYLAPDQAELIEDGAVSVKVPVSAFIEGNTSFECKHSFVTEKQNVSLINACGTDIYALGDLSNWQGFTLDVSKLDIIGSTTVSAIRDVSSLNFSYQKRRGEYEGKKVNRHFCVFDGGEVESFYEFNKKMYRLGKSIFSSRYSMLISVDNVRLAVENEGYPTITAIVKNVTDYGDKQYSEVIIGNDSLFVKGKLPIGEQVTLALDLDNVRVAVENTETVLF